MHLADHARAHIEKTYKRPLMNRLTRAILASACPALPWLFPPGARLCPRRQAVSWLVSSPSGAETPAAMLALAPRSLLGTASGDAGTHRAKQGEKRRRVAILTGCAQLDPAINAATIRLHSSRRRGWCQGRSLLRLAGPSHGVSGGTGAGKRLRQCRRLTREIEEGGRARRHHHHRVRLRHDDQGLRPHTAARSSVCRKSRPHLSACTRRH